jgi:hypothetical protein
MLPLQASTWDIAALRTVATLVGIPIATLIVTRPAIRTATLIVTRTAIRTGTATLVVADIRTTATGSATLMDETVETGERGVARPRQEVVGVGIVHLRAPGAGAVTAGRLLGVAAAVPQNPDPARLTRVVMRLFRPRRKLMEGGEP